MNFVGHAVVAGWRSEEPRWLFGAMVPDFLGMARVRAEAVEHPDVASGVAHHHTTDAVFHAAPDFVALLTYAARELRARGVPRGGARAVAHVGAELLLDGLLVDEPRTRALYTEAVRAGRPPEDGLRFQGGGDRERWESLHGRLEAWGPPEGYRYPRFVAERLTAMLARRPRLALGPGDAREVHAFLPALQRAVADRAASLLDHLRQHLG